MANIKYLLLLTVMFGLGLILLGVFNPNMTISEKEEISASVYKTWDAMIDTSRWDEWKFKDLEWEWKSGRPGAMESAYTVTTGDGRVLDYLVIDLKRDSFLVEKITTQEGVSCESVTTMFIKGGYNQVEIEEVWEAEGFLNNINLNLDNSTLSKSIENRLKALK